jgi:cell division transport system ATP-binding protein
VIRFDSVSKRYANGHAALEALSFQVGAGEMVFVTGHSGAGKSTLLKLIALIERPSGGMIEVAGNLLAKVRGRRIARLRRGIGMVFQDHRLLMDRSVGENVALPLIIADEPTGNLDPQLSWEIMQLFAQVRELGTTVLIASHDLPLLKRMKQRTLVLDHGRLVADVPAAEIA